VINAAATIMVGAEADDLPGGVAKAQEAIDSGAAREVLEKLVERSAQLAGTEA
jgi:anthranilate phosphoribosyltransferase